MYGSHCGETRETKLGVWERRRQRQFGETKKTVAPAVSAAFSASPSPNSAKVESDLHFEYINTLPVLCLLYACSSTVLGQCPSDSHFILFHRLFLTLFPREAPRSRGLPPQEASSSSQHLVSNYFFWGGLLGSKQKMIYSHSLYSHTMSFVFKMCEALPQGHTF